MAQLSTPLLGGLRQDVAAAPVRIAAPRPTLVGPGPEVVRPVTVRERRVPLSPLLHLVTTAAVLALLWVAGVQSAPATAGVLVAWPLLLAGFGAFTERPLAEHPGAQLGRIARAFAVLGLACWLGAALLGTPTTSGPMVATTAAVVAGSVLVSLAGSVGHRVPARLAVAGSPEDLSRAMAELRRATHSCEVTLACVTGPDTVDPQLVLSTGGVELHAGVDDVVGAAVRHGVDAVLLLPGEDLTAQAMRRIEWDCARHGIQVYVGTTLLDVAPSRASVVSAGGMDVLHLRPARPRGLPRVAKALVERSAAALALLLLSPALVAVGVAVRRDSAGPALFRQQRVGRDGRLFTMYKFRTMGCTAEQELGDLADRNEADGVLFKLRNDPRITRVGAVLRRYSIDEIPQLWNVVRGQMSLVGPRPALPEEVARYEVDPRRRLAVKPGLTGLWQVSGRSDLTWDESVRLDIQYVDNWSLPLDAAIICRTFRAVVGHRGAY